MKILIKRVYETPAESDGLRILADRLWPRGLTKERAAIDLWAKQLAPSTELRKWFNHEPDKFEEFTRRYRNELDSFADEAQALMVRDDATAVTLLFAAKDPKCNHAIVLQAWLLDKQRGLDLFCRKPV